MYYIAPDAPPIDVKAVTSSARAISASWQPPPMIRQNGIIVNYNITYYSSKWEHRGIIQVGSNIRSAVIKGLIPFTSYSITVSAATAIGFGPSSAAVLSSTLQAGKFIRSSS